MMRDSHVVLSPTVARAAVMAGTAAGMAASVFCEKEWISWSRVERKMISRGGMECIPGIMAPASISLLDHHLLVFTALHKQQ